MSDQDPPTSEMPEPPKPPANMNPLTMFDHAEKEKVIGNHRYVVRVDL